MEEITSEDLLKFWTKGKTLYESLYVYTDESIREKFNKSNKDFENQSKSISKDHPHGAPSVADGLKTIQETFSKYQGIRSANDELKRNLLNKLQLEKLIGLGFEMPIKSSSQPTIIPIHIWPNKINDFNWNESSFSSNGVEFFKIRLIDSADFENHENIINQKEEIEPPDLEVKDKKVGRPSKKEKIVDAYIHLREKGKINYSKAFKSHTDIIRTTVRLLNSKLENDKGLGEEAIRLAAKPLFDNEQSAQKST